ncbi:M10 family metallopeptidase [Pseudomonas mediterranea]|uniref:matrixin family metalloprotease n=1 Tax=Pseudomonas mediterranea TaxID=183795 RepID=UPI00191F8A32|nr:M10 family metallopeptidase [Pseudomonas mediterranea]MBL0841446.1 M10 family metallopeptidase C-terminal domain-containing protein [Pseudomonas mediterranea]
MPSPLGYSSVSSASLTGNAQVDSLIYGTYWTGTSNGTALTYSFITKDSVFARSYSYESEYIGKYVLDPAQKTAIASALDQWSSVANIKFTEVSETSTNVGDLRFGGYSWMDSDTAAWGYFPGRSPVAGDVWIGLATNDPTPDQGSYDYLTFMHEIGHALGLKHPFSQGLTNKTVLAAQYDDVRYTIMSYDNAYSYEPTTPMLLDIAAIQRLYGANTQWQTGNNTYSWATDQKVFETIWDAGGTDTIDASNQAAAVRINLNEGQFSKIGKTFLDANGRAFNEGLAIAYGAKIENAVGSAFDDTLIGNSLGNVLSGLTGKDTMVGGAGNDIYVVDNLGDVVSETSTLASEIDTVRSSVSWTLGANLENLVLTGTDHLNGTGNALNNVLTGNEGNNVLNGGVGLDTLVGGEGNDIYVIDNLGDKVTELADAGQDLIRTSVSYTLSANVEDGQLLGAAALSLVGNALDNVLTGNAAANVLNGLGGADIMIGGAGNDTYVVDNIGDTVTEVGTSLTEIDSVLSSITYTLGTNLEILTLTGTGSIDGTGNALNNRITGNAGANVLDGGLGIDTLIGGTGNDTYVVDNLKDVISETSTLASEIDTVRSSVNWALGANLENLALTGVAINATGNALDNVLTGNAGNNVLDGGAGRDSLIGGAGNDTYLIDNLGDTVTELDGEGRDLVRTSVSHTLSANVEDGQLLGVAAINLVGNASDNNLVGNSAANVLSGLDGADILDGGAGIDTLIGGTGNDTYIVDNLKDVISETSTLESEIDTVRSSVSWNLGNNLENLTLTGVSAINGTGNALDNVLIGNAAANVLNGLDGADTLVGGAGNDTYVVDNIGDTITEAGTSLTEIDSVLSSISYTLGTNLEILTLTGTGSIDGTGNALNNRITGNAGANVLDGGLGIDTLIGGTGNDTYVVDNLKDVISETSTLASEIDTVRSSVSWALGANLENLTLTGTAAINGTGNALGNVLIGNAGNNVLNGGAGRDTLIGGAGNDTYVLDQAGELALLQEHADQGIDSLSLTYASSSLSSVVDLNLSNLVDVENVILNGAGVFTVIGNSQDNSLVGNAFVNILQGGAGDDTLDGRAGADILIGGAGDDIYVIDNLGDKVTELTDEGHDLIRTAVSYTLSTNVEDGQLLGLSAINLSGNALDNSLVGNAAANVLNGLGGADTMIGGAGNDTYVVDNIGDTVTEAGTSLTEIDSVLSSISYTLGTNLEILTLTGTGGIDGTGNALNNRITGNAGANVLDGGVGIDTLVGGTGNDTYVVDNLKDVVSETSTLASEIDTVRSSVSWALGANLENLTLTGTAAINGTGNALANVLTGNAGNNVLDGGAGRDTLIGGAGNDTYLIDNLGDTVTELADEGRDLVRTSVSHTLSTNVEDGQLLGIAAINLVGNASNNTLLGNSAANVLSGLDGADILDGGAGIDTLIGGTGNDTYVVDNLKDVISETSTLDSEIDTVRSSVSWTLGANLENLTLTGVAAINATGNALDNVLIGNAASNTLIGGAGNDQLDGGAGNDLLIGGIGTDTLTGGVGGDRFVFSALNELGIGDARDVILDFSRLQGDKLDLSKLDANILATGINKFSFIDSADFSGAGQLRFVDHVLSGNIDGNLGADFEIQLVGVNTFSANDLVA